MNAEARVQPAWEIEPLSRIASVSFGTRVTKRRDAGTKYPVYGGGGATFSLDTFNREDCLVVSRFGMSEECVRYVSGKFFLNDSGLTVESLNQERLLQPFLDLFLLSSQEAIYDLGRGTAQKNLNVDAFKSLAVPVPTPEEQERIVATLDQAFAALDRARANAEANLADARKLFGAALDAIAKQYSSHQQKRMRLGSIVTRLTNGYVGPIRNIYVDKGVPYLLARHVRNNTLAFDGRTHISREFNEKHKKSKLKAGDVLLVQSGHIGHSAVVPEEHEGHNCHAMIVISPKDEIVSGPYLSMVFNTPAMQETFQKIRTGSTVPHLTCKMVKELMLDIPPRHVQDKIFADAKRLRVQIEITTKRYKKDISDIAALRQSLLQKAFAGQLS